jgi:hypothetical protein
MYKKLTQALGTTEPNKNPRHFSMRSFLLCPCQVPDDCVGVGSAVGEYIGFLVGASVGNFVSALVGALMGFGVGEFVSFGFFGVGGSVGFKVGKIAFEVGKGIGGSVGLKSPEGGRTRLLRG